MLNTTTKTLLILVVMSFTNQFKDFNVPNDETEQKYYDALTECFALHGKVLKGDGSLVTDDTYSDERDAVYIKLQEIYQTTLEAAGL